MVARRCLTSDSTTTTTAATVDAPSPAAPRLRWQLHGSAVKVAIAGNVVVAVLFFVAIVWRLFFSGKDEESDVAPGGRAAAASGASSPRESPRWAGLRNQEILALPAYVHGASEGFGGGGGGGKVECAVCLRELRDGDTARLLPACGHRFHAECVDRWFRSHITCPLCRAVVADGGSGEAGRKLQAGMWAVSL